MGALFFIILMTLAVIGGIAALICAAVTASDYEYRAALSAVGAAVLLLPIGVPTILEAGEWTVTGEGTHTGYVTAVGKHGTVWPTWTAFFKTDAESTQEDIYCVRDAGLITSLRQASEKDLRVEITYRDYWAVDLGECNAGQSAIVAVRVV